MHKTLQKAAAVNIQAEIDAFIGSAKTFHFEGMSEHLEAMLGRFVDAATPTVLKAIRALEADVVTHDKLTFRRHSFHNPWLVGLSASTVYDSVLVVIGLGKPSTMNEAVDLHIRLSSKPEVSIDREELAETYRAAGYPETTPDPATISEVVSMMAYRYDGRDELDEIVRAINTDSYTSRRVFGSRLTFDSSELDGKPLLSKKADLWGPVGWRVVVERLQSVCRLAGLEVDVAIASRSIGDRNQHRYSIDAAGQHLEDIGIALALLDGGFPGAGEEAVAWLNQLEAKAFAAKLQPRVRDLAVIAEHCLANGLDRPGRDFDYNDTTHTYARQEDGYLVVGIEDNREFLITLKGGLNRPSELAITLCHYDNPRNAASELASGKALPGGSLGRYDFSGDVPRVIDPPDFNIHTIRGSNLLCAVLESGAIDIQDTQKPTP